MRPIARFRFACPSRQTPATARTRRAAFAMAGALAGITAYLIVATVAAVSLAGCDLDVNAVAARLTVAGSSANDTIVIFDRAARRARARRG